MTVLLNDAQRKSQTWEIIRAHLDKRINALRKQNDAHMAEYQTAEIRGRIAEVKQLLSAVEPETLNVPVRPTNGDY